ncbi:MAG: YqgE/AlgH family protein [Corynebacterium sp.]|nr:YqgE/AlgH family protein [Corynebacterium sp.]
MYADRLFNALERNNIGPGQLLVAAPGMEDPFFRRSVLLMLECDSETSFAVALTMRSETAVFNVIPHWIPIVAKPQALYIGGPMNQQSVIGLAHVKTGVDINAHPQLNRLGPRLAHVDMRADPTELAELVDGVRLFAGYVEWRTSDLIDEIFSGDWYVTPALPSDVVVSGTIDLWGDVMRRQPMPLPMFSTYPADPTTN